MGTSTRFKISGRCHTTTQLIVLEVLSQQLCCRYVLHLLWGYEWLKNGSTRVQPGLRREENGGVWKDCRDEEREVSVQLSSNFNEVTKSATLLPPVHSQASFRARKKKTDIQNLKTKAAQKSKLFSTNHRFKDRWLFGLNTPNQIEITPQRPLPAFNLDRSYKWRVYGGWRRR